MSEHSAHDVLRVRLCIRPACEDDAVALTGLCPRHLRETMAPSLVTPTVTPTGPTPMEALRERRRDAPREIPRAPARAVRKQNPRRHSEPGRELSLRQREVMDLAAQGLATREIAAVMTISIETARWHLKACYRKLRATSRDEAIRLYRQPGGAQCPHCGGALS